MKKVLCIVIVLAILIVSCKRESKDGTTSLLEAEAPETCIDSAAFIADVTIPDNTSLDPGKTFKKTWRVKNSGTCTWDKEYSLIFAKSTQSGAIEAPESVPLKTIRPGNERDISVELTAPTENGSYRADFQLVNPNGDIIPIDNGYYLWLIITIE